MPAGYAKKGDPTAYYGAHYQIRQSIRGAWTGPLKPDVYPAPKYPRYKPTNVYNTSFAGPGPLKVLTTIGTAIANPSSCEGFYISASNPWISRVSCIAADHDPLIFTDFDYKGCFGVWMPGDAMNYTVNGLTAAFHSRESILNKSL